MWKNVKKMGWVYFILENKFHWETMTVSIYKKYAFFLQKRRISNKKNRFPLESNLIDNKVAYRRWVSNITVLKNDTIEKYTKTGV